jgi:hypothetical protein
MSPRLLWPHAWVSDAPAVAYEVTTPLPGLAYFGMPFSVERADDTTWWGDASVLDDWKRNHSLLCQPSQGETLLRHYRPSLASRQLRRPKRQGFTLFGALVVCHRNFDRLEPLAFTRLALTLSQADVPHQRPRDRAA